MVANLISSFEKKVCHQIELHNYISIVIKAKYIKKIQQRKELVLEINKYRLSMKRLCSVAGIWSTTEMVYRFFLCFHK